MKMEWIKERIEIDPDKKIFTTYHYLVLGAFRVARVFKGADNRFHMYCMLPGSLVLGLTYDNLIDARSEAEQAVQWWIEMAGIKNDLEGLMGLLDD